MENPLNYTYEELIKLAENKKEAYANADPFPSIYFDNFFREDVLNAVLDEFPSLDKQKDGLQYHDENQVKLASKGERQFGETTRQVMHYLNSEPFLDFLSTLTGIEENLIPDPYFEGGGLHQSKRGGMLKIHADFNRHRKLGLDRRINVLVYLNKDWEESFGGHFELWDTDMKQAVQKILPVFNRMAIFSTTDYSYHGHPEPLTCPEDRSRKSLALYYYSNGRPEHEVTPGLEEHTTIFKKRPGTTDKGDKGRFKRVVEAITPPIVYNSAKKLVKK